MVFDHGRHIGYRAQGQNGQFFLFQGFVQRTGTVIFRAQVIGIRRAFVHGYFFAVVVPVQDFMDYFEAVIHISHVADAHDLNLRLFQRHNERDAVVHFAGFFIGHSDHDIRVEPDFSLGGCRGCKKCNDGKKQEFILHAV
jgi:hypothetical protein